MMRCYQRLFRRARTERQLDAELRFHLEQQIADYVAAGVSTEEARRRARLEFGGLDQVKEECRDVGAARFVETLLQDVRYGLRQLRRNPGFTAVAVITLALGIGANTAIFSVVNAVLLHPLPYSDPGRLVAVWQTYQDFREVWVSTPDLYDWRAQNKVFDQIAAYRVAEGFNLQGSIEARWIRGTFVTANLFGVLGAKPSLGRGFFESEDRPGAPPEVILSHALWVEAFHASRNVIGSVVDLNGKGYTVVGVMPPGFSYPNWAMMWLPLGQMGRGELSSRVYHPLDVIGRLKRGVSLQEAQSEMSTIAARLALEYPKTGAGWGVRLISLRSELVGNSQRALLILLASTMFVLLIACANVSSLLLARASGRQREIAVRAALGAGRGRIVRQLLSESGLLALLGSGVGLALAYRGLALVMALGQNAIPRFHTVGVDGRVLLFTLVTTLLTGILFGLMPALRAGRLDLSSRLSAGLRITTRGFRPWSAGGFLVELEIALAVVVLVGSRLLFRSFAHILRVNPGFDPDHVLTARVSLLGPKYSAAGKQGAFYDQLLEKVRALPGVQAAGLINELPIAPESDYKTRFAIEGHVLPPGGTFPVAELRLIYPGYFDAMRIPLVRGRFFNDSDYFRASSVAPVIMSQYLAERFFAGKNPIGRRIDAGPEGPKPSWVRIVGVVGNTKESGLVGRPTFDLYFCASNSEMYLAVRTASNPLSITSSIRSKVGELDRTIPVSDVSTMEDRLSLSLGQQRFSLALLSIFGWLALALAACGIYAVVSYSVGRRTHEFGIRMALGAQRLDVLRVAGGQEMISAFIGIGAGIAAALGLTRFMASLLYGIRSTDPLTLVTVSLILVSVALLACYIPARRAAKVDPMVALRCE
jgi:putative ABC transport system permease protein